MPKILIIAPSWVGDTVMAQPLFKRLHERHANLTLDVLAPAWTLPLLQHMPEVQDVIANPFNHGELKLGARYRLGKSLRKRGYDQAIILPNSLKSALIPFFAGIPLRTGFVGEMRLGIVNDARHLDEKALPLMVERFAVLAEEKFAPLPRPLPATSLLVNATEQKQTLAKLALSPQKPVMAFCIGAEFGPAKRWPVSHFAELGKMLSDHYEVWLIGSHKDQAIGDEIQQLCGSNCKNLCGKTGLSDAISLLASASLVISNDSGLMHVAAALNKPMMALYGSSSPGFTPPLSDKAHVISLNLSCSPCFKRECPLGHFNCMNQLTPKNVLKEIDKVKLE
ncbi:lipopolysaccharide heptosyltransferase II [Sulfurirhabdus autotrophica]|uniref:lipopolysaccharide heptosyltransferase II n=1 Tax=Sulfurirhabdus autotrophica TaxID=1706046 RepID=A0A4R3Y3S6_9PROT|nr:lipopolysaccharide heptosyltransferase II [Sulfurirhabdus autotrophica]TCV85398.1 heptosyltransferase-2 [Sulfurirhabdus autotrophica]